VLFLNILEDNMEIIKYIHITTALLSITGFIIRGIWMMKQSSQLQKKWVKIFPHVNDTVLILSAVILAFTLEINPFEQSWLLSKIIALLAYITIGLVALKLGQSLLQRKIAWLVAILIFVYILLVAITKQSLPLNI